MSWLDPLLAIKTQQAGTTAGTRQTINFSSGATVTDDPANDRVNVAITDTGITQLTGDVTAGPGSGSIAATVAKVNGVSVSGTPTSGQVIRATSGTASAWANVARGDIANTSGATGDLITGDATTLGRLAIGSTGQVLTVSGGAPVWAAPSAGASVAVGPYASRPAATAGATYYPTDGWCSYVGDGTTWRPVIGGVAGTQPPAASTFTAVNMSATSTLTDNSGALVADDATGNAYRIWVKSLGAATNVEACVNLLPPFDGWTPSGPMPFVGVVMRESSTGKTASTMITYNTTGPAIIGFEYGTSSTRTAQVQGTYKYAAIFTANLFLRLRISGSNLIAEYSGGRGSFSAIATALALTTAFTTAPDQCGLIVYAIGSGPVRLVAPHLATY